MRTRLVDWYRRAQRDLPWRRTSDPYRIWLSEAMLQQTRVEAVIPYYERFLERFPDVGALACAEEQDVLQAWSGLGYYSRARNLKRAAEQIVADHAGALPRDEAALLRLPGIGAYTAGAIRSIAFRERAALVDGNVKRVLSRVFALAEPEPSELWALADELTPQERPDLFNQGLMELGAIVCTPRKPRCADCPLGGLCAARRSGQPQAFPKPKRRTPPAEVSALAGALLRAGAVLLVRRPSRGLLGGLWELPNVETKPGETSGSALVRSVRERTGIHVRSGVALGSVRHVFTHRALTLDVVRLHRTGGRRAPVQTDDARFCTPDDASAVPLSRLTRKTLVLAGPFA